MTKIEFKTERDWWLMQIRSAIFFIEKRHPVKDYLEYWVRKKLGQNLNSYADHVFV